MKTGLAAATVGFVAMPLAASAEPAQPVPLTKPIQTNVTSHSEVVDGDRTETQVTFDLVGANGAIHRVTGYNLKIDREGSYDITSVLRTDKFKSADATTPADRDVRIIVVSGKKGEEVGGVRADEIRTTVIGSDGITKTGPQTLKKSIPSPLEGMPAEQMVQAIIDQRVNNR